MMRGGTCGCAIGTIIALVTGFAMKVTELMKQFEDKGWILFNVRGKHYQFRHAKKKGKVTLPPPRSDISENMANTIKQLAIAEE